VSQLKEVHHHRVTQTRQSVLLSVSLAWTAEYAGPEAPAFEVSVERGGQQRAKVWIHLYCCCLGCPELVTLAILHWHFEDVTAW